MQGRMLVVLGTMSALLLSVPGVAVGAPKDSKVLRVDSPFVSCDHPLPGAAVDVEGSRTFQFSSPHMVDFVEVRTNKHAELVSWTLDLFAGEMTFSKNVNWYVVWSCEFTGGGGGDV